MYRPPMFPCSPYTSDDKMELVTTCPICSGHQFTTIRTCTDFTTTKETFNLAECIGCNFVFTQPRPAAAEIGKYYQSDKYISHTGGSQSLIDRIYLLARQYTLAQKRKTIERHAQGKTILDFGCGTGEFLKEMQGHGYQTVGVEPADNAREKSIQLNGKVIASSLDQIPPQPYDVITLWHVLEHLHEPAQYLRQFHELLSHSGTIFIAVPNRNAPDAKHYQSYWAAYDVPRHLWHFSQQDMTALLRNHGFKLKSIHPMKLDSYYVSMLSESYKSPHQPKWLTLTKAFYNGLNSNLKAAKSLNHSSLIYVATK